MKLNQVLSIVNQVEKSKFISCLDRLCSDAAKNNKTLAKTIDNIDGQIKNASGSEITHQFITFGCDRGELECAGRLVFMHEGGSLYLTFGL